MSCWNSQFYDLSNDIEQRKQVFVKEDSTCDPLRCSICHANQIDLQFDQCGHMCCHRCNQNLMKEPKCPFCHKPILSTSFIKLSISVSYDYFTGGPLPVKSPLDKDAKPEEQLQALAQRSGKPENVMQTAVGSLVNNGHDEDSAFEAPMEPCGDRDKTLKILEDRKTCAPAVLEKDAKPEEQLQALAQRSGKPENVMQTTVCSLVNKGHDEDSAYEARRDSCGDREEASEILDNRKTSTPAGQQ
nr:unnamed protein product [Spirometra erinaceieuropaei]